MVVILPLLLVFFHLLSQGASSINWAFFTQLPKPVGEAGGGMANAIAGTFILISLASLLGVPVGVLGGIFLSEYTHRRLNRWIRFTADVVNGVPSITWGMVVYGLVVVPMKGFSTLAGALVLGLMMIPLIMRTTEEVLQLVPNGYREAALALGIAQWRMIAQIVVRTAMKGIVTGVLLALARVAGETAPLLFTAFGNGYWTHRLTEPIAALPLQIFNYAISPYDDWHRQAWAGALGLDFARERHQHWGAHPDPQPVQPARRLKARARPPFYNRCPTPPWNHKPPTPPPWPCAGSRSFSAATRCSRM